MLLRAISSAVIGLACGLASSQTPPMPVGETAATVNGEVILVADVDAVIKARLVGIPLTAAQYRQLRRPVVEDQIDDALLRQFLEKKSIKVEAAEIEAQMTALRARLISENQTLAAFLKRVGQTEAQLRASWELQLQLANYTKQLATDDKLKAYHAANRDHFDKVEVQVSHILIRCGKNASPVERAAAKEKLQAVRTELAKGSLTFAEAAKRYSQCPSALKGGDLGFIRRRGLPEDEPLARAAFALKVGGISEIIETYRGFHLLTVTHRKPGTPSVLDKCVVEVLEEFTADYRVELVARLRQEGQVKVLLP